MKSVKAKVAGKSPETKKTAGSGPGTRPGLRMARPSDQALAKITFSSPAEIAALSRVSRNLCEELGKVMGIVTGVVDFGANSGNGDIALETSASVSISTDYALTLTRNLTFIEELLAGEGLQPQKCDMAQLLMDTYTLNQKYLTQRQTFPSLVVDKTCTAVVDPNAVHHVICTLLIRSGKHIQPGGSVTLSMNQRANHDLEITYHETMNPYPVDSRDAELVICKMLIASHGGEFEVTSDGNDRKFTILFPAPNGELAFHLVNKRRHRRARVTLPVEIKLGGRADLVHSHSVNLSVGGVLVFYAEDQFEARPVLGEVVAIDIHCSRDRVLKIARARVVTSLSHAFGLEFIDLDDKSRRILTGIVKSRPY